jgi:hypothetical protein
VWKFCRILDCGVWGLFDRWGLSTGAGKLALAGFSNLIKVPPPEVRQGLSGTGYHSASAHRSRSTHSFDFRRSGSPNRMIARRLADFRPHASDGGYWTRRLSRATGGSPCGKPASLRSVSDTSVRSSGSSWRQGWLSQVRDAISTTIITIRIPVRRGRRSRAPCAPRRCATHRLQSLTAERQYPTVQVARQPSPVDSRGRRASS